MTRPRKPAAQREAEGNRGRRPIPAEPEFRKGSLRPPRHWTKRPGYERVEWDRIVPELERVGIAKAVHQGALEKICELYASSVVLYKAKNYQAARNASSEYRRSLHEFGLTAASAASVGRFVGGGESATPADTAEHPESPPNPDKYFGRPTLHRTG